MKNPEIQFKTSDDLVEYPFAIDHMQERVRAIIDGCGDELVWFLQHPPLYTAGTSAKDRDLLDANRLPVFKTGRGGEHTYHGPGQRVGYVMLDLNERYGGKPDLRKYVSDLEQWIINSLQHFYIKGERRDGRIGIWVKSASGEDKIAALGIRVRKWVSFHGISINLNPDLSHFTGIVPCGIKEYGVTSFEKLAVNVSMKELDDVLRREFLNIFA